MPTFLYAYLSMTGGREGAGLDLRPPSLLSIYKHSPDSALWRIFDHNHDHSFVVEDMKVGGVSRGHCLP